MVKPNRIDKEGNECIHVGRVFTQDKFEKCQGSFPDCVADCKRFYVDHEDCEEVEEI